ncbi:AMP-binding protein [Streptomyces sp. NPDC029216]|uniref:AMP-binding protein n=1 Tax=Streptomyces sp. NPDC029216 TaxID=3154701 RepID=UPI00340E2DFE
MTNPDTPIPVPALLERMAEIPALSGRYDDARALAQPQLSDLPILTKDDFRSALPDVLRRARRRTHGAIVLGSGGTTSTPKLSFISSGQLVEAIAAEWSPLGHQDVLVNYDTPGRLCSSHNFFNAVAHQAGAVTIPLGAVDEAQLSEWLDFVDLLEPTALNATQSQIANLLEFYERTGRKPPTFTKLLWTGEPFGDRALEITRRVLPDAELHGVYGSTETWVIGHNGPGCDMDTFHLMPYQHIELEDGAILVTNLHPECINPVVRYRIGDVGEFTRCACGREDPALRVLGRDDPQMKFLSVLVTPQEIAEAARVHEAVRDVQIALFDHGSPAERMELRVKAAGGADPAEVEREVRRTVLTRVYRLGYEVETEAPNAFSVRVVERFTVNERSNKTPLLVKDSPSA